MDPLTPKHGLTTVLLSNILVRLLSFCVLVLLARFTYSITVKGQSCNSPNFCFFSKNLDSDSVNRRAYYGAVFEDLIREGFLSTNSKSLCIETIKENEVVKALKEVGVLDSVAIANKNVLNQPFKNSTFDFEFSSVAGLDRALNPVRFALEVCRTLKPGGFFVVHTQSANDEYSLNSLLELFDDFAFINLRTIDGLDSLAIREIVLRKVNKTSNYVKTAKGCSVSRDMRELIGKVEPLIKVEPLKPWIAFKRNVENIKYLSAMVDISFKNRYVYIDVGARTYGSSIGGWFTKQYPKQGKSFEIYAVEADSVFHDEYETKKGVSLLPYAAWIRNESLFFEIGREPMRRNEERRVRGMGRIRGVHSSSNYVGNLDKIRGFDFAMWLKRTFMERDYVVVKMDVEGTEFPLISRLVETGAICLIDEMFVECHYSRWQRCCPGKRSPKYQKTYAQCLELFSSLRKSGVLVHQWW